VRAKAPDVPPKLARVVARALQRDRAERYQSAEEMLADLEAALRESRALSTKTRATASAWSDSGSRNAAPERYRSVVLAVVAALAGFAVAAYLIARSSGREPVPAPPTARVEAPPAAIAPANEPAPPAPSMSATPAAPSSAPKPMVKAQPAKAQPAGAKRAPASSPGVAGGLGLSTREP
jgi:hypothetical protein